MSFLCHNGAVAASGIDLYQTHYVDKADERLGLFALLAERFVVLSALYPGSFTHLTPAFIFPCTCFVDTDRRAASFFADPAVLDLVRQRKRYPEPPVVRFHAADYAMGLDEPVGSFDLLISQYAGFVSRDCKRYLRQGGYLLANNSHADAGMASLDPDYRLSGVVHRRGEHFRFSDADLESYFTPRRDLQVTRAYLERTGRGVGYRKTAFSYIFQLQH